MPCVAGAYGLCPLLFFTCTFTYHHPPMHPCSPPPLSLAYPPPITLALHPCTPHTNTTGTRPVTLSHAHNPHTTRPVTLSHAQQPAHHTQPPHHPSHHPLSHDLAQVCSPCPPCTRWCWPTPRSWVCPQGVTLWSLLPWWRPVTCPPSWEAWAWPPRFQWWYRWCVTASVGLVSAARRGQVRCPAKGRAHQ